MPNILEEYAVPISGCGDEGSMLHSLTSQKTVILKFCKSLFSKSQEPFTIKKKNIQYIAKLRSDLQGMWLTNQHEFGLLLYFITMPFSLFTVYLLAQTKEKNSSLYNGLTCMHLILSGFSKIKIAL
jgi:hypothetical protein